MAAKQEVPTWAKNFPSNQTKICFSMLLMVTNLMALFISDSEIKKGSQTGSANLGLQFLVKLGFVCY